MVLPSILVLLIESQSRVHQPCQVLRPPATDRLALHNRVLGH